MEPLLGWQFEDSLFAPSRERGPGGGAGPACGAKHCEPRVRSRGRRRRRGGGGSGRRGRPGRAGAASSPLTGLCCARSGFAARRTAGKAPGG